MGQNILRWWKIWPSGRSVQKLDSFAIKPSCCNSCNMQLSIVSCKAFLKKDTMDGSTCCSETCITFQNWWSLSRCVRYIGTNAPSYHHRCISMFSKNNSTFKFFWTQISFPQANFKCPQSILNELNPLESVSGLCSHIACLWMMELLPAFMDGTVNSFHR